MAATVVCAAGTILAGGACGAPEPQAAGGRILPYRWVFISKGMASDGELASTLELVRGAAAHGYSGILFDPNFTGIPQWERAKLDRVVKVKQECDRLKLDVVAMIMSAGYGNGVYSANRNLAEGLPVRDVLFEVKGGVANVVPDRPLSVADGRFETASGNEAKGWDLQDEPGKATFVDTEVVHEGKASLRFEPAASKGRARIMKILPQKAKHYLARFWVKGTGLKPSRITICVYDKDLQVNWYPIDIGEQWQKVEFSVLAGENAETRLYIGTWEGKQGKFWLADMEIVEPGLVNVLRRPGTPLVVRKDGGGEVCAEGKDFEKVVDPALKVNQGYHAPPAIKVIPGGGIKDGERLRVSYYVHPVLRKGQAVICMSEPETYDLWRKAVEQTWAAVQPMYWFLDMDEIRGGGTCQACRERKNADGTPMTAAGILGDCVSRQMKMIRQVCPKAEIACWSDMLDPNHNGKAEYMTVPGGYAGAWKYIPKDLIMCPWDLDFGDKSVAFFGDQGFRTIAGAYYDVADLVSSRKWLDLMEKARGGMGMVYFTWESKFDLMPAFGDLVSHGATPAMPAAPAGTAVAAPTADLLAVPSPTADDKVWSPLFNGRDLGGWKIAKGEWQVTDGCIAGKATEEIGARLDSEKAFGDCELTCRVCSDNCKYARIQLRDWQFPLRWASGEEGTWRTFRLVSRGGAVQASLDGVAVPPQAAGNEPGSGIVRVFVGNPYEIKLKDVRTRSLTE